MRGNPRLFTTLIFIDLCTHEPKQPISDVLSLKSKINLEKKYLNFKMRHAVRFGIFLILISIHRRLVHAQLVTR